MALTDEQAWTLTSAGLVALADGVLKGGEAARILGLANEQLAREDQDAWIDRFADRAALWDHARGLPRPPAERTPDILRSAWSIALVDGEGSAEEAAVLDRVGELLGVDGEQLKGWRKTWTAQANELAQYVAAFAAMMLHRRADAAREPMQPIDDAGRAEYGALLARLPLSEPRRKRALRLLDQAPTLDELGGALQLAEPERRGQALDEIARLIRGSDHVAVGRQLFLALAARMAVPEDVARVILG
ncbi:TerB family tellurite resistance protein [Nannocystis punicea]|uniref:TerB family tellurite resistance protein n=1 Tax=Nannocystis punicea TaxID=2995304 RepID=A0ABY7GZL7_9BACT|nr:TerB family tellurite resistance protein [Nannocystis poenicansa]WAS92431.1 TerB family tellurite resistance protein [Nannocystis poenicansa]